MTEALPPLPISLADVEAMARERLDPGAYAYIAGGAMDEWTMLENVAAWRRLSIVPRMLTGATPDMGVTVLGAGWPHPLVVAPMAYQRIACDEGEVATARAAAATSTTMCLSALSHVTAGEVAAAVPQGRRWYQVYVYRDRGLTDGLIEDALSAGCQALVVTVDFPVSGRRERDLRSGYRVADVPAVSAAVGAGSFEPGSAGALLDATLSWADLAAMAARHPVPLLVKGVLSADDAIRALAEGAAGVVVSNHGGRQLDGAPATAVVLPDIVDAIGGAGAVLVDGGIRRGTDVLRALALGANAVMVGRPLYWGLAAAGAAGAQRVVELLLDELSNALVLSGAGAPGALDRNMLRCDR